MRYLLRFSLSVLLAFCMVFSNSYYAIANSTTEQSYNIMPLSAVDTGITLTTGSGYYDLASDEWYFGNAASNSNPFNTFSLWPGFSFTSSKSTYASAYYTLSGSGLPSAGDSWRIFVDNYRLALYLDLDDNGTKEQFVSMADNAVPFISEVEISYRGSVKLVDGNTFITGTATEVIPFSSIFNGTGVDSWNKSGDITLSFSLPSENYIENGREFEWQSANVTSITFRTCYAINDSNFNLYDGWYTVGDDIGTQFGWDMTRLYIIESESTLSNESSVISAGLQSVNTSINNLGSNMSNQITNVNNNVNQVKTQITQSTSTITTKIDTMSSNIQQGLQNVVQSAQQNTQNIINTVTTKVDEVKTGITQVKDSILDLPNKLEEKALSLVVPEQEVLESKFSEIEDLLRGRFGLIYQAEEVIVDFANSLQTSTATTEASGGKIIFPSVVVNLPDETVFNFGGYEVDLIPDGFETLANAVRLAVNMVCTAIFINMCKNKLEVIFK